MIGSMAARLIAVAAIAVPLAAQEPPEATLLRCAEGSNRSCLVTNVRLTPEQLRRASGVRLDSLAAAWRARFLGDSGLFARGRRSRGDEGQSNRLLVLIDVSGSMKNLGIGTVKLVVRDFLQTLDSLPAGSLRVAVAPFGSRSVAQRIKGAAFTTPDSARLAIDVLPDPETENTGLFSAVELATARLGAELSTAGPGDAGALIVITDGDNDVGRPGDDPGLLAGDAGLARAARAVDQSPVVVNLIGIGKLNEQVLETLAGSKGRKYLVRLDAYELAKPLGGVRDYFWSNWEVAVPLGIAREALGRGLAPLTPAFAAGGQVYSSAALWRPPVLALPAFGGIAAADFGLARAERATATGIRSLDRRLPLVLMVAVLLLLLWLVVPRLLWPPLTVEGPAVTAVAAKPKAAPVRPGGLRVDVTEIAPRRPTDVTAARARKA